VLVPVKRLGDAKSRLSIVLSAAERAALMEELLDAVLAAADEADVGPVTIVSGESLVRNGAPRFDDHGLPWNDALAEAMRAVVTEPIATVLAGDLPHVSPEEIRALVEATPRRGVAVARALDGGTNAVSMRPPGVVRTCFGQPGSAALHAGLAGKAGLEVLIVDLPGLAFDVDTPEDLDRLRREVPAQR
jgi:2-phospho-L-lactate/phosphoenolpyruvate guanylyltransferase